MPISKAGGKREMINWFTVEDKFTTQHGLMAEFCLCDEKEEGHCLCDDCFREVKGWLRWMEKS
jgi:hypothetical protein